MIRPIKLDELNYNNYWFMRNYHIATNCGCSPSSFPSAPCWPGHSAEVSLSSDDPSPWLGPWLSAPLPEIHVPF